MMKKRQKPKTKATKTKTKPRAAAKAGRFRETFVDRLKKKAALFKRERDEALEQQAATSEVLKVISRSPGKLKPVFDAMLKSAVRICEAKFGNMLLIDGDNARWAAGMGTPRKLARHLQSDSFRPTPGSHLDRVMRTGEVSHTADDAAEAVVGASARLGGARSTVCVPMLKDETLVGAIFIYRTEVRPFTDRQIDLVRNFAQQAVIAIENARLFNEVQAKTRDLAEALEQQTATSEVLEVISTSQGELDPVFTKLLENATRVCGANFGTMNLYENGEFRRVAQSNMPEAASRVRPEVIRPHPESGLGIVVRTMRPVQMEDIRAGVPYREGDPAVLSVAAAGARTLFTVPMLRDGELLGTITIYRQEVRPFTDQQIELVASFARQAVIAIENARLINETKEALERQTATGEILEVIAAHPSDLKPVFETIVKRAHQLIGGYSSSVMRFMDDRVELAAFTPISPETDAAFQASFPRPLNALFSLVQESAATQVLDTETDTRIAPTVKELAQLRGYRSVLMVPLKGEGGPIGQLSVTRREPGSFDPKHVDLLRTFARQAVIAIQNVGLFEQVQAKSRDLTESLQFQTASSDVLKVISRSPDALQPVLDVIVDISQRLCESLASTIFLLHDGKFHVAAHSGATPEYFDALRTNAIALDQPGSVTARAARVKRTVHVPNTANDPELGQGGPVSMGGPRAMLSVPLIHDGRVIGCITLRQSHLAPFTSRQIEAVETFADQAVIAISNVNLFEQVQQRTRELSQSLDDLRTAQDRLVQTEKLASLGQLTAGIAHEIKNPLNFVNNFSALSAELVDELDETLAPAPLDQKMRGDVGELTQMLKSNLEKVVQHGKRADSIVKNMLLHSREGSGEHREVDINALVDESLNLAYHGARAEKPGFNITMQRNFDPAVGEADVYPQEVTRVLLNLISNGFYAATKRMAETDDAFEPMLSAETKSMVTGSKFAFETMAPAFRPT